VGGGGGGGGGSGGGGGGGAGGGGGGGGVGGGALPFLRPFKKRQESVSEEGDSIPKKREQQASLIPAAGEKRNTPEELLERRFSEGSYLALTGETRSRNLPLPRGKARLTGS